MLGGSRILGFPPFSLELHFVSGLLLFLIELVAFCCKMLDAVSLMLLCDLYDL